MSSILKTFRVLGRIIRDTSPRATGLSLKLLYHRIFIVRAASAPLLSPADFPFAGAKLLLPARFGTSWFRLQVLLPHVFLYVAVSRLAAFSAPCSGGFCVFLWPHSPPICRLALVNLGVNRPFVRPLFFPPACCTLIWRVPCQHSCWFKSFITSFQLLRYSLAGLRISLRTIVT